MNHASTPTNFQWRLVPGWARPASLPIKNGHGLVFDKSGKLKPMETSPDDSLNVGQFDSGNQPLLKLERA